MMIFIRAPFGARFLFVENIDIKRHLARAITCAGKNPKKPDGSIGLPIFREGKILLGEKQP